MKYAYLTLLQIYLASALCFASDRPSREIERKVNDLLKKMTLEEKVGQKTQITLDVVSKGDSVPQDPHAIDTAKLQAAILKYHVGSILNVATHAHSIDHWHDIITAIQDL